jgi:uncharacterized protein YaeQ
MALKATIFKADLQVSDLDRNHYASHALTLARHPSETDERMMARLLAFALNAHERLAFGRGLSTEDEPDLWRHDLTGAIEQWIDVGLPDERRLRKASGRASEVRVYAFGGRAVELWWTQNVAALRRLPHLQVWSLPPEGMAALTALAERTMRLTCTIQDGQVWVGSETGEASVEPAYLTASSPP